MNLRRKKRLYHSIAFLIGIGIATSLTLYALGQNIDLYVTPTQLFSKSTAWSGPQGAEGLQASPVLRLGGMVKRNSFRRIAGGLKVEFVLTDYRHEVPVVYTGILPALFREGQGVVVQGKLNASGYFIASQVLAKHDEKYMPPEIPHA